MTRRHPQGARWWLLAVAYTAIVLAAQPRLGLAVDAFKARWGDAALATTMMSVAVLAALVAGVVAVRVWRVASAAERFFMLAGGALYVAGILGREIPQERLHYLEYGTMAALFFGALRASGTELRRAAAAAVVMTFALGYLDEELQGRFWERRYFDWMDVWLNFQAAVVGVLFGGPILEAMRRVRTAPEG